jgi:hypothetical protein
MWERVGLNLSMLLVDEAYLRYERPEEYEEHKDQIGEVAFLINGKDLMIEKSRNSGVQRQQYSNKEGHPAVRVLAGSTTTGLVVFFSSLFLARKSESGIVQLLGSLLKSLPIRPSSPPPPIHWNTDVKLYTDQRNDGHEVEVEVEVEAEVEVDEEEQEEPEPEQEQEQEQEENEYDGYEDEEPEYVTNEGLTNAFHFSDYEEEEESEVFEKNYDPQKKEWRWAR